MPPLHLICLFITDGAKYKRKYLLRGDIFKDIHSARIEDCKFRSRYGWFHAVQNMQIRDKQVCSLHSNHFSRQMVEAQKKKYRVSVIPATAPTMGWTEWGTVTGIPPSSGCFTVATFIFWPTVAKWFFRDGCPMETEIAWLGTENIFIPWGWFTEFT